MAAVTYMQITPTITENSIPSLFFDISKKYEVLIILPFFTPREFAYFNFTLL